MFYKKHSGEFKCAVVRYHLETHSGYKRTALHFSINRTQVRNWVRLYYSQGYAGLLKRQPAIRRSSEFKRHVVETMIDESLSSPQTSVRFDHISQTTVLQWKRLYDQGLLDGSEETLTMTKHTYRPDLKKPDTEKTQEELVRELQYMSAEVAFLKKLEELKRQKTLTRKKSFLIKKNSKE